MRDPEGWKSSVNMNKTGDGIQMALNAGAQMGPVSFVGHLGTEGKGIKFLSDLYTTSWQPSALWVNSDGNRFANEDVAFSFSQAPMPFMHSTAIMPGASLMTLKSNT